MKKTVLLVAMVAAALLMTGCSYINGDEAGGQSPKKKQASAKQEKTVMVNEGLSKKEEEKLNERLDELEKKVESQDEKGSQDAANPSPESDQPEQPQPQQAEDQARAAAEAYYEAVAARNWGYTYDHLDSETQSAYTEQEWLAKNEYLANTGTVTYTIESVVMDSSYPETVADVTVVLTTTDGSTSVRNTYFVYEDGSWLHRFSPEEYDLLASAPAETVSASPSASATASDSSSASASATGDTKHVKVVITSSKPADVSINDDSLNWFITEEITGTETYERDIAANSGLSVSATTDAYHAQTTIEVYENGELVAQDSDPTGFATVNY